MTEGNDWLDRLSDDEPPPVDPRRARRRLLAIVAVALAVVAGGITVGLLVTPPLPECVPLSAEEFERLKDQAADAPPGTEQLVVLTNGGLCGSK
ncbi:hypothetical protein [Actinokineospora sp. HUAS TT18]|uniref:hypothetical protein n=1 Tax=Actinokineospora sp. HUAS TT18 TaxID=3447451 RepID=UPI003F526061